MSEVIDLRSYDYGHGIVSQNCLARKYLEPGFEVELVSTGTFVQVHRVQSQDVLFCIVRDDMQVDMNKMVCKKGDIISVPENLWGPLFTVKKVERLSFVKDSKIAESIGNISVGHTVQVLDEDNSVICIANVTFRNSISILGVGIYFGLQVLNCKEKLDRIIEKISLLQPGTKGFPRGCDIVVSIDKIRPFHCNSIKEKPQSVLSNGENVNSGNFRYNLKEKHLGTWTKDPRASSPETDLNLSHSYLRKLINSDNPLLIGDEVIYLDGDKPEKGVVKSISFVDNSLKVGVEFDNPIGVETGDGTSEVYRTKYNRHAFVPPMALIKSSDYQKNETNQLKKTYTKNNNNNNNNNINNVKNTTPVNNNNSNSINNNCDCSSLNESSFEWKQNSEDIYQKGNKVLESLQCLKHSEKTFDGSGCFHKEDIVERERSFKCSPKTEGLLESENQRYSKSFDYSKPNDKKVTYKRSCNSVDNGLLHKEPSAQNSKNVPVWNRFSLDLFYEQSKGCSPRWDFVKKLQKQYESEEENLFFPLSDKWESERWSSNENIPNNCESSKPHLSTSVPEDLGKGSVVELLIKGEPHYGVIRWIGNLQDEKDDGSSRLIAGIEMEEESPGFTDGTFNNKRYFLCNPRKALFVPLSKCKKDSRFLDEPQKPTIPSKVNYGQIDCPIVEGTVPPINRKGDIQSVCGKNRGIQGHHNSCYLDATLFSMFAFTSVFDSLLYRPPAKNDIPQYSEVQRVLREEIVNPLRKNLYVRADRVMKLRTLLEKLSSVSGLTSEEKDPEEFLNSLLAQILKAEPFLKLSSGQEAFHYQLFVEKDERLVFPSVQQLFEQSFVTSDIKLKQIPSCLIIQMPRFGKSFKMYSRILPPQLLDITDIIENSPRQCTVCGKLAEFECKDCFGHQGIGNGLESISFCKRCLDTAHNHHCRSRHNAKALTVPVEFYELQEHCVIPRLYMELFAVVCIETSHYVAFVKCGSGLDAPWCFFDSMADRKGEQNGYNIPEMVSCPDLPYWLSEDGTKMLNEMQDERQLPEHAKRLFSDAYMCMYQSPDLMMYR